MATQLDQVLQRNARRASAELKESLLKGVWRTIRGARVLIDPDGGKVLAGPPRLKGKTIGRGPSAVKSAGKAAAPRKSQTATRSRPRSVAGGAGTRLTPASVERSARRAIDSYETWSAKYDDKSWDAMHAELERLDKADLSALRPEVRRALGNVAEQMNYHGLAARARKRKR